MASVVSDFKVGDFVRIVKAAHLGNLDIRGVLTNIDEDRALFDPELDCEVHHPYLIGGSATIDGEFRESVQWGAYEIEHVELFPSDPSELAEWLLA